MTEGVKLGWIGKCVDYPQAGNQSLCIFLLCTEVNSYLCIKYFLRKGKKFSDFRSGVDYSLIQNELLGNRSEKDNLEGIRKRKKVHYLDTTRAHANKWRGQKWDCGTKIK